MFNRKAGKTLLLTMVILGSSFLSPHSSSFMVHAITDGTIDTTFGFGGTTVTNFDGTNDVALDSAVQADGKIVLAGRSYDNVQRDEFAVARYNSDGTPDSSFSSDGEVMTSVGASSDQANAVAIQNDGRIVVAGQSWQGDTDRYDYALVRYNTDGSLDTDFSTDGKTTFDFGDTNEYIRDVLIQPDGKIIVVGETYVGARSDIGLLRYNQDGTLDGTFGTGGKVQTEVDSNGIFPEALVLQPDGKIVVGAYMWNGSASRNDFVLIRYTVDGGIDPSFGTGGFVFTNFSGQDDYLTSLALQTDGHIIAAGMSGTWLNKDFAVARYTSSGDLDQTFGIQGKATTSLTDGEDKLQDIQIQSDGKIVAVGYTPDSGGNIQLVRFRSNGTLDSTFNTTGAVNFDAGGVEYAFSLAIQPNNRLVAAGFNSNGGNDNFYMAGFIASVETPAPPATPTADSQTPSPVPLSLAPTTASYSPGNQNVTVQWSAVDDAASYVVKDSAGVVKCTSTTTSCAVLGLKNGRAYSYFVYSVNSDGAPSTSGAPVSARPGFQVKKTSFTVKKSVKLSSIVTTPSKGAKTWQVTSGSCRLSGSKIVMPKKSGTCKMKLSVAKSKSYPKMSTSVRIAATR